jgi:hypothetical protein
LAALILLAAPHAARSHYANEEASAAIDASFRSNLFAPI